MNKPLCINVQNMDRNKTELDISEKKLILRKQTLKICIVI